jgi:hypothetical protein
LISTAVSEGLIGAVVVTIAGSSILVRLRKPAS